MGSYSFQMYTPDLQRQMSLLQKKLYRSFTWRHTAYMEWKHLRNPYWDEPLIYLALCDNHVVGIRAMFGTCWEAGEADRRIILPCASDAGIAPEYRNSGLFEELTEFAMEDLRSRGFKHVLNLSPTASNYVVSVMTMGWRSIGSSGQMVRQDNDRIEGLSGKSDSFSRTLLQSAQNHQIYMRTERLLRKVFRRHAFIRLENHMQNNDTAPIYVADRPNVEGMEQVVRHAEKDGRLRHVRDQEYLSWRFGNPRFVYRFLYWGGREPEGYMVLQNRPGDRAVNIVDWEGRTPVILTDLLDTALNMGMFSTVHVWAASRSDSVIQILERRGFVRPGATGNSPDQYQGRFMIKSLAHDGSADGLLGLDPEKQENWDIRMIYSDGE
jgi:GNAT superfamily N-acetyltransferase